MVVIGVKCLAAGLGAIIELEFNSDSSIQRKLYLLYGRALCTISVFAICLLMHVNKFIDDRKVLPKYELITTPVYREISPTK